MSEPRQTTVPPNVEEQLENYKRFLAELAKESDRAAVILGAARLDELLLQILQRFLLPNTAAREDELLDSEQPLGPFSARIKACARLGLLAPDFVRALHLVRKIRNGFAHAPSHQQLDSSPHRDRVLELVSPFKEHPWFALYE